GCTKGQHSNEKPPEPVKPEVKTSDKKDLPDLKPKFNERIIQAPKPIESIKRPRSTFAGPLSNEDVCQYHAGVPIFHEGMKYWSCCMKRTSDFNTFLAQVGCAKGTHLWIKKDDGKKVVPCRHDWHQTGGGVTISIYAKNSLPELSYVEANGTLVNIQIVFDGEKEFQHNLQLWGVSAAVCFPPQVRSS
ncbi:hypothetical protein FKM82_009818, partial [Ascaphus truei]